MKIEINSVKVIDTIVAYFDAWGSYTPKKLKGKTQEQVSWARHHESEATHVYDALADTLGCHYYAIIAIAHVASRWYKKTNWMHSMPESMADALIAGAISGTLYNRTSPREPGYYSDWAARRADARKTHTA